MTHNPFTLKRSEEGQRRSIWEVGGDLGRKALVGASPQAWVLRNGVWVNVEFENLTPFKDPFVKQKVMIVMHDTATNGVTARALAARDTNPNSRPVSWGKLVGTAGEVYSNVDETKFNSWHAGKIIMPRTSPFRDFTSGDVRQHACGIENINPNLVPGSATDAQLKSLPMTIAMLMFIHGIDEVIPGVNIFMHRDLAGFRGKTDAVSYLLDYVANEANRIHRGNTGPRLGSYWINTDGHIAALVRPIASTSQAPIGRLAWNTRVNVIGWEPNGQLAIPATKRRDWARVAATAMSPAGWIYGPLLSEHPLQATLMAKTAKPTMQLTAQLMDWGRVNLLQQTLQHIDCGGLAINPDEAAAFARLGIQLPSDI